MMEEKKKRWDKLSRDYLWTAVVFCVFFTICAISLVGSVSGIYEMLDIEEVSASTKAALYSPYIFGGLALFLLLKEKLLKNKAVTFAINVGVIVILVVWGLGQIVAGFMMPLFKMMK